MNLNFDYLTQVVGCTKNMIRTVKKMKEEGKSLEPNFKGGAKRIGRESVLERFSSLQANNPSLSMRAIAKKLGVSRGSLGRILKGDEKAVKVSQFIYKRLKSGLETVFSKFH